MNNALLIFNSFNDYAEFVVEGRQYSYLMDLSLRIITLFDKKREKSKTYMQ